MCRAIQVLVIGLATVAVVGVAQTPYESGMAVVPQSRIDKLVFGRLKTLGITPATLCPDDVFVRRVYLDTIGTIPTAAEVRAFLRDPSPNKRDVLVDRLLERDEFADYWAMKWCDLLRVKSEFPINLWPNAVQAYHRWIRAAIKGNKPYDQFARDLLTSSGSNFRVPQVNFLRAVQSKDPATLAQAAALTFMGTRADKWPKERLANLSFFFSQVGYKSTAEWKEEILFFDPGKAASNTTSVAVFPDGTTARLVPGVDPRKMFADWLIRPGNAWFTRALANRVWSWLLGRGIIHEPDDIRPDNPPANPELLAYLEQELVANKYDVKSLFRLILKSKTYQLSCIPKSTDPKAEANFAFYAPRRLEAEVLIDALNQITGTTDAYSSSIPEPYTFIPPELRAIALADASISSPFLDLFGRSPRDTGTESERNSRPTVGQRLHLLNSSHIQEKLTKGPALRALRDTPGRKPRELVDELYLTILSRYPTDDEVTSIAAYKSGGEGKRKVGMDLAWALINSTEFQFRH